MLIECPTCNARVDAEVIAYLQHEDFFNVRTYLLKCPSCTHALVGETEEDWRDGKSFLAGFDQGISKAEKVAWNGHSRNR